jgi:uncharacterized membrane protein
MEDLMRAHLLKYWNTLRSSYWFVPTLMTLAAIGLSFLTTAADAAFGSGWIEGVGWIYPNTADGARSLLSTIGGSMITVAGVTFSITIAAVAYATSMLGPRLLSNFMRDVSNQITLGTFIATFLYCLLVLRTVHSGSSGGAEFVPHIGVLTALFLTLASLVVLIYFIHHIPKSIQASEVISEVGMELNERLVSLFPGQIGHVPEEPKDPEQEREVESLVRGEGLPIDAPGDGYIEQLDADGLLALAQEHDLVVALKYRPGDFVYEGEPLAHVNGLATEDALIGQIRNAFALGRERTQVQDVMFLVQQLVEIAAKALSPGVNDPFTAISCMNWLGSGLRTMAQRQIPSPYRYDDAGRLRVIAPTLDFEAFVSAIFDRLRPYVSTDRNASLHMMEMLGRAVHSLDHEPQRRILLARAEALTDACESGLDQERDRQEVNRHLLGIKARLAPAPAAHAVP